MRTDTIGAGRRSAQSFARHVRRTPGTVSDGEEGFGRPGDTRRRDGGHSGAEVQDGPAVAGRLRSEGRRPGDADEPRHHRKPARTRRVSFGDTQRRGGGRAGSGGRRRDYSGGRLGVRAGCRVRGCGGRQTHRRTGRHHAGQSADAAAAGLSRDARAGVRGHVGRGFRGSLQHHKVRGHIHRAPAFADAGQRAVHNLQDRDRRGDKGVRQHPGRQRRHNGRAGRHGRGDTHGSRSSRPETAYIQVQRAGQACDNRHADA